MNNRGSLADLFIVIVVAFVFTLVMISLTLLFGMITDTFQGIQSTPNENVNISQVAAGTFGEANTGIQVFYWAMGVIVVGMFLSILISNFLVKAHPVFLIAYIFLVVVAVIVSVGISNAYESAVLENQLLGAEASNYLGINTILLNLPIWITIIGGLGAILLFAGMQRDAGGGGGLT